MNQCDGCRRGLVLRANGLHYDAPFPKGLPVMACTKDLYIEHDADREMLGNDADYFDGEIGNK